MNVTTGGRYWLASSAPKMGEDTSSDDKTTKVGSITLRKAAVKATAPEACQLHQSRAGEKYLLQVEREVQVQKAAIRVAILLLTPQRQRRRERSLPKN